MSKATAQDMFLAFKKAKQPTWQRIELYNDESGAVVDVNGGGAAFLFQNFDDAMEKFSAREPIAVGDTVVQGPYMFRVTNLYPKALRADRSEYGDRDYVVYVPYVALKQRPGTRTWAVGDGE